MTAANACPDAIPKTPIVVAIASSKLLLAAVNARVVVSSYENPRRLETEKETENMRRK